MKTIPISAVHTLARNDYRNFLFVVPVLDDPFFHDGAERRVIETARMLAEHGYVYIARAGQPDWEDDEFGVRHLPLDRDRLPCFGTLHVAFVVEDAALASVLAAEHPGADVFILQLRRYRQESLPLAQHQLAA